MAAWLPAGCMRPLPARLLLAYLTPLPPPCPLPPAPPAASAAPMAADMAGAAPTPISLGKQEVTATVSMVYDFTA